MRMISKSSLTHRERVQACLTDDPALDHPPVALWRHFPVDDQSPEKLAAATYAFQSLYDFDLVKITPASSFCIKDWGVTDVWEGDTEGTRRYTTTVIHSPQDWEHLPVQDPSTQHLSDQLACIRLLRAKLGPDVPLLQTIFSPLAQAKNLVGGEDLVIHIQRHPEALLKGLKTIAETIYRFVEASIDAGIDGIFYAVQHAQAGLLSLEEYKTFGLFFDKKSIDVAQSLWCNLLHLHGKETYFSLLTSSLSFPIVNWHDRETSPSLVEAQRTFKGTVCGGISLKTIVYGDSIEVGNEAQDAFEQTISKRFILGTGCVVPIIAPHGNIMAAKASVTHDS